MGATQQGTRAADPALWVRGLTRSFGPRVALEPLSLKLNYGEITGLIGPNGSGKTTLLRMLVGLLPPHGGTAEVAGIPLTGEGVRVRRVCTYAPGEIGHYGELSLEQHLAFLLAGRERAALARALELCERLGLPRAVRVRGFSHGMKRQMLFAAALAPDVALRILDEPTEGLDPTKRGAVLEILREDLERGAGRRATLLSSHHLGEVDRACHRLLFLDRGRLIADERAEDLAQRARRLVRFGYRDEVEAEGVLAALSRGQFSAEQGVVSLRRYGATISCVLADDDPRAFLAAVCARGELPAPRDVAYGQHSLAELYRDLYGVEGL